MNSVDATAPAVHYMGRTLPQSELAAHALALAEYFRHNGVTAGDRVLLQLQNMPETVIACMAVWRIGAVIVPVNPMYKARELQFILRDCRPAAAVVLDDLVESVVVPALSGLPDVQVITTGARTYADSVVASELRLTERAPAFVDFASIVGVASDAGVVAGAPRVGNSPNAVAALVYTSGTTGPPKGAMLLHRNLDAEVAMWQEVYQFRNGDSILSIAPFFHVTGLVADLVVALDCGIPVVCSYRFDPALILRWIDKYQPTSMVAAITAYIALLNQPGFTAQSVRSLRTCLSGGAPVSPATVEWWHSRTGHSIRNCYGLTESSSLATMTPPGAEARIDPASGALSVGKPVRLTRLEVWNDHGAAQPPHEVGEVVIAGPQIAAGYWLRHDETARTFGGGVLRTGDVGFLDQDNWLYLIDRKKDLIVTGGYKVWPREVEDVLMQHPAVLEAAVVGVPDDYRGENVTAYVSLRRGSHAEPAELVEFCRARIAVFKAPRQVMVLDELPKTLSGKILRRQLRGEVPT